VDPSTHYDEVVTVYLGPPIACCGNGVCEPGEDTTSCGTDCHPGTWAKDYPPAAQAPSSIGRDPNNVFNITTVQTFAVAPDDAIVAVGMNYGPVPLVAGPNCPAQPNSQGLGVLAKYNQDGTTAWVTRFGPLPASTGSGGSDRDWEIMAATVDSESGVGADGSVSQSDVTTVVGWELAPNYTLWVSRFDACGVQLGSTLTFPQDQTAVSLIPQVVTTDASGNIVVSGAYSGNVTFGSTTLNSNTSDFSNPSPPLWDVFVVKLKTDGTVLSAGGSWLASPFPIAARTLTVAPNGHLVLLVGNGPRSNSLTPTVPQGFVNLGNIESLCPDGTWGTCPAGSIALSSFGCFNGTNYTGSKPQCADGSTSWITGEGSEDYCAYGQLYAAATDADGNVYATGSMWFDTYVAGRPVTDPTSSNSPPWVVKYGPDGSFQWHTWADVSCPAGQQYCNTAYMCWNPSYQLEPMAGVSMGFDQDKNVIVASFGDPPPGGSMVFGSGPADNVTDTMDFTNTKLPPFPSYGSNNIYISAYSPTGYLQWAKRIPMILSPSIQRMVVDGTGHVVMSGAYGGSMEADGVLLVTADPAEPTVVDSFLASFPSPPPGQTPQMGVCTDPAGNVLSLTKPADIIAQATSPLGANVFYMPPTAVDPNNAGVTVYCTPRPNTTFALGPPTLVTCIGSDPRGAQATQTFTVTVVDTLGPVFYPSGDLTVVATSSAGAPFSPPVAIDQVDGSVPVSCSVGVGSVLSVGKTSVTCSAADHSGNQSQEKFTVTVVLAAGLPCSGQDQCATDACVDGVCCKTTAKATSCGQCQACNVGGSLGKCAPTSGGSCDDHDACTQTDTCQAGVCKGSNPIVCTASDQCHVAGTCDPSSGCSNPAAPDGTGCDDGNVCTQTDTCQTGVCTGANPIVCKAEDACHLAGTCAPSTGICSNPIAPPTLNAGTNQTIVGSCSSAAVTYTYPTAANGCSATVTCTSIPGNSYGAHTVTCTATGPGGTSAPVSFTVTVLQPLTIMIQPPLSGDNDTVDNIVKDGSTVPNKILLYGCGTDVTRSVSVIATLGVTFQPKGGASNGTTVAITYNGAGDTNGIMVFDGAHYHYNLATKGFAVTQGVPGFYQENIKVAYQSAPTVIVGTDAIQIDTK
jgi:hypothetical protein